MFLVDYLQSLSYYGENYIQKKNRLQKNIFLERSQLHRYRKLPEKEEYENFVKRYPRWWYQSYCAWCFQKNKEKEISESMFYYYKPWIKEKTNSKAPTKKNIKTENDSERMVL